MSHVDTKWSIQFAFSRGSSAFLVRSFAEVLLSIFRIFYALYCFLQYLWAGFLSILMFITNSHVLLHQFLMEDIEPD